MVPKLRALQTTLEGEFLTQADLTRGSGVWRVTINHIEQQLLEPRFNTIRKRARALNVEPADLVWAETAEGSD
jgi:predicted transcriptional regulator